MKRGMASALVLLFCVAVTVLPGLAAAKEAGPEGMLVVTYYYLPG